MATRRSITSTVLTATRTSRSILATRHTPHSATFVTSSKPRSSIKLKETQSHRLHYRPFHTSSHLSSQSSTPKYSYRISASFTAKDHPYNPTKNTFNYNPFTRFQTHLDPSKKSQRPDSGQDAFFVSRVGESGDVALGVCDGVGGWAESGVDPADFAHGICGYMADAAYTPLPTPSSTPASKEESKKEWTPLALLESGYNSITHDPRVHAGGSTACIAIAKSSGSLEIANLGDSGFIQLRLNAIHNLSEPQTHAFNTPYQLSLIPGNVRKQEAAFGGYQLHDLPSSAALTTHTLRHGDILVLATDGVWDNLSPGSILSIVSKIMIGSKAWEYTESEGVKVGAFLDAFTREGEELDTPSLQNFLAVGITGEAKAASVNTKVDGPFAREVQRWYPEEGWRGGKVDDICVVVMVVVEEGK